MKTKTIMKILTIVMIVAMLATVALPVFAETPYNGEICLLQSMFRK